MATDFITWAEVQAECDGYREGFVAIFRKYEGMETDAVDPQGRPVVVSQRSFCERMGIPRTTFKEWVATAGGRPRPTRDRTREAIERMSVPEKAELVAQIMDENPAIAEMSRGSGPWVDPDERTRPAPKAFPPEQYDADEFATPRSDLAAEAVIAGLIRKARRSLTDAISEAKGKTFPVEISADLRSDLDRVRAAADFLDSALTSDVEDFDAALASLLGDS